MNEVEYRAWHKTEHVMGTLRTLSWGKDGKLMGGFLVGVKPGEDREDEDTIYLAPSDGRFCSVGEMEIMAFTGLRDKRGRKIFTGDIIRPHVPTELEGSVLKVVFHRAYFGVTSDDFEYEPLMIHSPTGEVIGNIWQQPELLWEAA